MDAWTFSSHLTLSVVTNNASAQSLLIPAFFACMSAILFGMRYGTLIRMYAPAPPAPPAPVATTAAAAPVHVHEEEALLLPSDDASVQQQPSVNSTPGTEVPPHPSRITRALNTLLDLIPGRPFGKHYLLHQLSDLVTQSYAPSHQSSWRRSQWRSYVFLMYSTPGNPWYSVFCTLIGVSPGFDDHVFDRCFCWWYCCVLVPQIVHNVRNGTGRRGLRKRYVIGSTVCRLYLPLYVSVCPSISIMGPRLIVADAWMPVSFWCLS